MMATFHSTNEYSSDVIVIGGGAIGSAVAYGLVKLGKSVIVLDEGDTGFRAARGNAGLIWYQLKGLGFQDYSQLCLEASEEWADFANELETRSGIELHYSKPGGIEFCRSSEEFDKVSNELEQFRAQSPNGRYDSEMIDRQELQAMMPKLTLAQSVVGAAYSPHDGQVYAPALLQALHTSFQSLGGQYHSKNRVTDIATTGQHYTVTAGHRRFSAEKIVVAAGLGLARLGKMLSVSVPVRPQRGHLIVTERLEPMLKHPAGGIRQTPAGNFLLGSSKEWAGYNETVSQNVLRQIASKWVDTIPALRNVSMIRCWAALRPMMPDGAPVYQELDSHPGIYMMTSHSGISLTSVNADRVARWVAEDRIDATLGAFNLERFETAPLEEVCSGS